MWPHVGVVYACLFAQPFDEPPNDVTAHGLAFAAPHLVDKEWLVGVVFAANDDPIMHKGGALAAKGDGAPFAPFALFHDYFAAPFVQADVADGEIAQFLAADCGVGEDG